MTRANCFPASTLFLPIGQVLIDWRGDAGAGICDGPAVGVNRNGYAPFVLDDVDAGVTLSEGRKFESLYTGPEEHPIY